MTPPAEPLDELVAHAHETRVVVVGGGIAGLVAALECAKVGMAVTLVEASERLGGVIRTIELDGLTVDAGAQGYGTQGGAVPALVDDLKLSPRVQRTAPRALWLSGLPAGPVPLPGGGVLGIPENPWDEQVRRVIGWRGAWRAYVDRLRPPLTIGQERSLGRLVRTRMGERVLSRLVAPPTLGTFAVHPDDVDVEIAAPGLSAALTRSGSLSGAVAQVREGRRGEPRPGYEGIEGGMSVLVDAMADRLAELGADVRRGTRAESLHLLERGDWQVRTEGPDAALDADVVIVAAPEAEARALLTAVVPSLDAAPSATAHLDVVTFVVSSADLSAAPRRTEVFPVEGTSRASALADLTAQWPALRSAAGADRHVLRVTFGGPGDSAATAGVDDAAAVPMAVAEASALLGVRLDDSAVRDSHRQRYAQPLPISARGQADTSRTARDAIRSVPGLAAVGAWLAGTGLAQVVPDASAEAERVRRSALWGDDF